MRRRHSMRWNGPRPGAMPAVCLSLVAAGPALETVRHHMTRQTSLMPGSLGLQDQAHAARQALEDRYKELGN